MSTYTDRKIIAVSAPIAWKALAKMNLWLPKLSTNQSVTYDTSQPFFVEGKIYYVRTKEGVMMKSQLFKIDQEKLAVEICAKLFLLRSFLTCQVNVIANDKCEIVRTQSYPGIVGKLFTTFFNQRESGETSEYLDIWEAYALKMANDGDKV